MIVFGNLTGDVYGLGVTCARKTIYNRFQIYNHISVHCQGIICTVVTDGRLSASNKGRKIIYVFVV